MLNYQLFISENKSQRCDKIIWHLRFSKTRKLASAMIENGFLRVNNVIFHKASQKIHIGDYITLRKDNETCVFCINHIPKKRLNPKLIEHFITVL